MILLLATGNEREGIKSPITSKVASMRNQPCSNKQITNRLKNVQVMSSIHDPLNINWQIGTFLVFPRLLCKLCPQIGGCVSKKYRNAMVQKYTFAPFYIVIFHLFQTKLQVLYHCLETTIYSMKIWISDWFLILECDRI